MIRRPGNGRPIESKVFRPMTIGLPSVTALKRRISAGRCHGIAPALPITRLRARAATRTINGVRVAFVLIPTHWHRLGWCMLPGLIAWVAALMTAVPMLVTLMAGIGVSHLMYLRARDRGELPVWYLTLRRWTNAVAVLSLGASLLRLV